MVICLIAYYTDAALTEHIDDVQQLEPTDQHASVLYMHSTTAAADILLQLACACPPLFCRSITPLRTLFLPAVIQCLIDCNSQSLRSLQQQLRVTNGNVYYIPVLHNPDDAIQVQVQDN